MMGVGRTMRVLPAIALAVALAACGGPEEPRLMNLVGTSDGPDEFAIVPTKPLQQPEDLAFLPEPTPDGINRADATPDADAIAALGGNAERGGGGSSALISYATRFGVAPGIRTTLADEDLEFRRENDGRLLERLFNVSVYFRAYRPQALDQYRELERFRAAGIRTPAVPPDLDDE